MRHDKNYLEDQQSPRSICLRLNLVQQSDDYRSTPSQTPVHPRKVCQRIVSISGVIGSDERLRKLTVIYTYGCLANTRPVGNKRRGRGDVHIPKRPVLLNTCHKWSVLSDFLQGPGKF